MSRPEMISYILASLLAVSEVLASIPALQANSNFQLAKQTLKAIYEALFKKPSA